MYNFSFHRVPTSLFHHDIQPIAPLQAAITAADDKLRWFHRCAGDGRAGHAGTRWLCWFGRRLVIEKGRRCLRMDILDDILGPKPS